MTARPTIVDVTALMLDLHAALAALFPRVRRHGASATSDAWQEVSDSLMRALVFAPALASDGADLPMPRGLYGLWGTSGPWSKILTIIPDVHDDVLVADVTSKQYAQRSPMHFDRAGPALDGMPVFFREFLDPIADPKTDLSIGRALGESRVGDHVRHVSLSIGSSRYELHLPGTTRT